MRSLLPQLLGGILPAVGSPHCFDAAV